MVYAPIGLDLGAQTPEEVHYLSLVNIWQWYVEKALIAEGRVIHES